MEIKVGAIGKATISPTMGYHGGLKDQVILVVEVLKKGEEDFLVLFNPGRGATTIPSKSVVSFNRTKLKEEVRKLYQTYYKEYQAQLKLKTEMEKIDAKIHKVYRTLREIELRIGEEEDTITPQKVLALPNIYYHSLDGEKKEIGIWAEQRIQKWASPRTHSFISMEYDQSLHIDDDEAAVKQVGLKVPESVINQILKTCKNLKFIDKQAEVDLGDKGYLTSSMIFYFSIKKNLSWSDVSSEIIQLSEIIKSYEDTLPQN